MGVTITNAWMDQVAAAAETIYTAPANTQARIIKCTATNDTTTATTLTFYKTGTTVTELILNAKVIGNKETYECPEVVGQVVNAGNTISAFAGVADQITIALDVVEIV